MCRMPYDGESLGFPVISVGCLLLQFLFRLLLCQMGLALLHTFSVYSYFIQLFTNSLDGNSFK